MDIRPPFDLASVHDVNAWQPLRYVDGSGNVVTPKFAGAQWQRVMTFAITPGALRSSNGPARYGSAGFRAQARDLLDLSARLTDEQKMIAEYWADGPRSELPPRHWKPLRAVRCPPRPPRRSGSRSRTRRQAFLRSPMRSPMRAAAPGTTRSPSTRCARSPRFVGSSDASLCAPGVGPIKGRS
jgi:hypothetical protein